MCELVRGMCSNWAVSIRTTCGAIGVDRSTFRYKCRHADQAAVGMRIEEICKTARSSRSSPGSVLREREGWGINIRKAHCIYREFGMQLRNKTPNRQVKANLRNDRSEAIEPNVIWAMDFVYD